MELLLLETFGLCLAAPVVLACFRRSRIALGGLVALAALLGVLAAERFRDAGKINRALERRVQQDLPAGTLGRHSVTLDPIPGLEGIHVSVVGRGGPPHPPMEAVRAVAWHLEDPGAQPHHRTAWFHAAGERMPDPDDGTPLFEIGDRPLRNPVTLAYDVTPETQPWLGSVALRVRPDWFSLKAYPPLAALYWYRGVSGLLGIGLSLSGAAWIIRSRRRPPPPAT